MMLETMTQSLPHAFHKIDNRMFPWSSEETRFFQRDVIIYDD